MPGYRCPSIGSGSDRATESRSRCPDRDALRLGFLAEPQPQLAEVLLSCGQHEIPRIRSERRERGELSKMNLKPHVASAWFSFAASLANLRFLSHPFLESLAHRLSEKPLDFRLARPTL